METIHIFLMAITTYGANDAELVYQRMEEKLAQAKTINCVFECEQSLDKTVIEHFEGSLLLTDANQMRLELKNRGGKDKSVPFWKVILSDGTDSFVIDRTRQTPCQSGPGFDNSETVIGLARIGAFIPFMVMEDTGVRNNKERYGISEFQMRAKEKIGNREVQSIEYRMAQKGNRSNTTVVIWLEQETGLPRRREILIKSDSGTFKAREDYKKFVVNEKINANEFDLNQ